MRKRSIAVSICLHSIAGLAGFWLGTRVPARPVRPEDQRNAVPLVAPRDLFRKKQNVDRGGGQRMPLPVIRIQTIPSRNWRFSAVL